MGWLHGIGASLLFLLFVFFPYFLIFAYSLYCHSILQEKIITSEEFIEMPNCIGDDDETHRPDTLNFSRPCVVQRTTRSQASPLPTIVEETSPTMLKVPPPPPTGMDFRRVTVVQESEVDEKLWHIARILYNSSKACWAIHTLTKKKYTTKIVSNSKSTSAPAYLGVWNYYKFTTPKSEKFFSAPTTLSIV